MQGGLLAQSALRRRHDELSKHEVRPPPTELRRRLCGALETVGSVLQKATRIMGFPNWEILVNLTSPSETETTLVVVNGSLAGARKLGNHQRRAPWLHRKEKKRKSISRRLDDYYKLAALNEFRLERSKHFNP